MQRGVSAIAELLVFIEISSRQVKRYRVTLTDSRTDDRQTLCRCRLLLAEAMLVKMSAHALNCRHLTADSIVYTYSESIVDHLYST